MTHEIDTVREAAQAVARGGRTSARFYTLHDIAQRNGYSSHRGGYIKNDATGGTVARGWKAFAELVLAGNIPLKPLADFERADYYAAWDAASETVKGHPYAATAQECASRGDWVRAESWLREAQVDADAAHDEMAATWAAKEDSRGMEMGPGHVAPATIAKAWDEALAEDADRASTAQLSAWTKRHNLVSGHREIVEIAIDADHAEALRTDDAREAYAHGGYAVPMTAVEIAQGYTDWDGGTASDDDVRRSFEIGARRRAAEDADVFWLTPKGMAALEYKHAPQRASAEGFRGDSAAVDAVVARGHYIQQEGIKAKSVCLRTNGAHVGHMLAVTDECRTETHQDPYDAASEAMGSRHPGAFTTSEVTNLLRGVFGA